MHGLDKAFLRFDDIFPTLTVSSLGDVNVVVPGKFCPSDHSISCTGSHTLTQANVDGVQIINTAKATASPPIGGESDYSGNTVSAEDSDTVSWLLHPGISVGEHECE